MAKASATAHAIQGLVKYHGLKDKKRRIPYHDSISVCAQALTTVATIEFDRKYPTDTIWINGRSASPEEATRVHAVISPIRRLAKSSVNFRLVSANSLNQGKGLGFSASAFASIALAAAKALDLKLSLERLSEIARLGAGSASRSVVGGFSIWFANRGGRSYAEKLATSRDMRFAMAIVPIPSNVKTEIAHEESVGSPFFRARLKEARKAVRLMRDAIRRGETDRIGQLAEAESLSLHAVTMTGRSGLLMMAPETLRVIDRIRDMRENDGVPVWYSLDTGPSVYANTYPEFLDVVCDRIRRDTGLAVLKSGVGGSAHVSNEHLF